MDAQPLEVDDFSGGVTDYYVGAPSNRYQKADNLFLIKYDRKARLFTRPGSEIYDATNYQIPAGAQRIGTLKFFSDKLFVHSARKFYYIASGSWQTLQGPTGNDVFPTGTTVNNIVSNSEWQGQLFVTNDAYNKPQKIFQETPGVYRLRTAGLPALATPPVITPGGATGKNFLYRFIYSYSYTVSGLTYLDRGPTIEVAVSNADAPEVNANAITAIPYPANGTVDNYEITALHVEIYRTVDNGDVFYYVNEVTNPTNTYNDNTSDTILVDNELLYTEGGVVENDPPPLCKLVHINQQKAYYANTLEGSDYHKSRVYQSVDGDPDSVPATFFADVDDEIIGMSSVKDSIVLCCNSSVWRVDGAYDLLGRGGMSTQKISDTASCISSQSVVQTLDGVFWCGLDSFYFTDGFRVYKLNRGWDKTHALFVDLVSKPEARKRVQGKYDPKTRRIYWAVWEDAANSDIDKVWVLDLNWPNFLDGTSDGAFTSWSGADNFSPTAMEFVNFNLIRGDKRGYLFEHSPTVYSDPKINTLTNPSTWPVATILYDYRSMSTNFGSNFVRKFTTRVSVTLENETNVSLQITSNSDKNKIMGLLKPIRFRGNMTWGDPDIYWGDPNIIWNYDGLIDQYRRFPASSLRCSYKQIYLSNAFVVVVSSDLLGTANVNNVAKTATLVDTASYDWPSNSIDYFLAFEADNYVREYLVTARSSDVLTFTDPMGFAPTGVQKWVLRGYPKDEIMNLVSYTIHYTMFGQTQTQFTNEATGEVGSS